MKTKQSMKKILFTCYLFTILLLSNAQTPGLQWAKKIGGTADEFGFSIARDQAGNIYTTGFFRETVDFNPGAGTYNLTASPAAYPDIFISKLDPLGNFLWAKRIGGNKVDVGEAIVIDSSGNVYTAGFFCGTVDFDPGAGVYNLTSSVGGTGNNVFISKLDASGNFLWTRDFGSTTASLDEAYAIATDDEGNVYTTGQFTGTADFDPGTSIFNLTSSGSSCDVFISKLDSAGSFVWAKQFISTYEDKSFGLALDEAGNVFTTGYRMTAGGAYNLYVSKSDTLGNQLWVKIMTGTGGSMASGIAIDIAGNACVTGEFSGTVDFNPGAGTYNQISAGSSDIFILKLNTSGNFVFAKQMGGADYEDGYAITTDNSGNIYVSGFFSGTGDFDPGTSVLNLTPNGQNDIVISRLDSLGNLSWVKNIGGIYDDRANAIIVDNSNNLYVTGSFGGTVDFDPTAGIFNLNATANYDMFIMKLDQSSTTSLNETVFENTALVYPNPFSSSFNILLPEQINNGSVEVYNTLGAIVYRKKTDAKESNIEIKDEPNGIYFVKIKNEDGVVILKKLVKNE
jgi:hypothetical protein